MVTLVECIRGSDMRCAKCGLYRCDWCMYEDSAVQTYAGPYVDAYLPHDGEWMDFRMPVDYEKLKEAFK